MNRRNFNKSLVGLTGLGAGIALGAIPLSALAAWPTSAFEADSVEGVASALFDGASAEESSAITVKAPDIAENGAVVPITIKADMDGVSSIALLVEGNPAPLAASFEIMNPSKASVSTRIKMGKTSPVIAMVQAGGKLYKSAPKEVKVTIGGCGG